MTLEDLKNIIHEDIKNITHEDITKCIQGGQPSGKFHDDAIVYSKNEVRANVYVAMKFIENRFWQAINKEEAQINSTERKK